MTVQELIDELEVMDSELEVVLVLRQRHPMQFGVGPVDEYADRVYLVTGNEQGYVQGDEANRDYATG